MTYLYVGSHAETLTGGRRVAPGDEVPNDAVDVARDTQLIDEGRLVALAPRPSTKKENDK